jgi:hypothetical protein
MLQENTRGLTDIRFSRNSLDTKRSCFAAPNNAMDIKLCTACQTLNGSEKAGGESEQLFPAHKCQWLLEVQKLIEGLTWSKCMDCVSCIHQGTLKIWAWVSR